MKTERLARTKVVSFDSCGDNQETNQLTLLKLVVPYKFFMTIGNPIMASCSPNTNISSSTSAEDVSSNATLITNVAPSTNTATWPTTSTEAGGYDYDLVDGTDTRYECPICLLSLRDPVLTTCGHRFCSSCINQWVTGENGKCPVDSVSLSHENIFPDNFTRREVLQTNVKCPNTGCTSVHPIGEMEKHIETAHMGCVANGGGGLLDCPYKEVGCVVPLRQDQMDRHLKNDVHHHLQLLTAAYDASKYILHAPTSSILLGLARLFCETGFSRLDKSSSSRRIERSKSKSTRWLQRARLRSQLVRNLSPSHQGLQRRYCHGVYVWRIPEFRKLCLEMRRNPNRVLNSPGFYTDTFGYKLCLRFNLKSPSSSSSASLPAASEGATSAYHYNHKDLSLEHDEHTFISFYVHFMQGEFDDTLNWPFHGDIKVMMIHPTVAEDTIQEIMHSSPGVGAFAKPTLPRNPKGWGYNEFCPINKVFTTGFVKNDTLLCKVVARSYAD
ncbi:TNF receptor-associated factor 6 [Orchesella cincta]|uniref:TNF receptor-associated factor 6 n=1 Tax=Orchesella cincta TaxID=48709 RepID=A0A1D2MUY4_ORCCI|nr:TNF receptor-associated factor 6 [Orchesella cincta]